MRCDPDTKKCQAGLQGRTPSTGNATQTTSAAGSESGSTAGDSGADDPTTTSEERPTSETNTGNGKARGLPAGAIAGISVGVVSLALIGALGVAFLCSWNKSKRNATRDSLSDKGKYSTGGKQNHVSVAAGQSTREYIDTSVDGGSEEDLCVTSNSSVLDGNPHLVFPSQGRLDLPPE